MEQNIIGLGFDIPEFSAEQNKIIAGLKEVLALSKQVGETKIAPGSGGGYTELIAKNKELITLQKQMAQQAKINAQIEKQAAADYVNAQRVKNAELIRQKKAQEELTAGEARRNAAEVAYFGEVKKANGIRKQQAVENKKTGLEEIKAAELKKQLNQEAAQQLKNTVREELNAKGSIEQRRAALIRLAAAYDRLSAAERASPQGVRLGNVVTGLTTQVKELESATGRSQRNVGNYASAFGGLATGAQKAFSALRLVANILPGLGLSGVILLAIEPLKRLYEWITKDSEAVQLLENRTKIFGEIQEDAAKATGSQVAKLILLRQAITDTKRPMSERIDAVRAYNKLADEGNKIDEKQIDNLSSVNSLIETQITLIGKRALSKAFENKLGEAADKITKAKLALDLSEEGRAAKAARDLANRNYGTEQYLQLLYEASEAEKAVKVYRPKDAAALKAAESEFQDLLNLAKNYINLDDIITKEAKEKGAKSIKDRTDHLSALKELLNNDQQLYELYQKARIRQLERGLNSEKVYYLDKLDLANQYRDAEYALIKKQESFEIDAAKAKQKREEQALKESKSGKSDAEKARIDENIKISQKNLATEIITIGKTTSDKLVQMSQTVADKKAKILLDELKNFKDARDQELEYEEWTQKQIDNLNKARKKAGEDRDKQAEKDKQEKDKQKQLLNAQIEKDAFAAYDLAVTLMRNRYETELNYIQSLIDANNELKATETKNINDSTVSNQEKAALLIQLDAKTAASNIRLSQQMKEVKRKEAIFDRDAAVIKIAAETAVAVMKVAPAVPLMIATAAFGAIQIATLLARPIPNYGEGTDNHPGGPMIVGEKRQGSGYEPELVTNPDGSSFVTHKPMLLNGLPGTKVKPLGDSINQSMYNAMLQYTAAEIGDKNGRKLDEIKDATIEGHRLMAAAMRKQKPGGVIINVEAGWGAKIERQIRS